MAVICSATGLIAVLALLAAQVVVPAVVAQVAVPLALTGIVLGVPHGACDHMVPFWTTGRRVGIRPMARVLAGYLAIAVLAGAALLAAPTPTIVVFLLVSAAHFGRAEVVFAAERAGRPVPAGTRQWLPALAHGAAVVGLPIALWPAQSAAVLGSLAPALAGPLAPPARAVLAATVLLAVAGALSSALRHGTPREAAELALVAVLFCVVPPLAAFGVYFAAWHALRHTGRLLALPGVHGAVLPVRTAVRRLALQAALPTAVSLLAVLLLAGGSAGSGAVAAALAVLVALTFPHVGTVAALDRWSAGQRATTADSAGPQGSRRGDLWSSGQ